MGNSCSPGCRWWCLFVLSFFPLDLLDENWDLIESVSEGFLTYSFLQGIGNLHWLLSTLGSR